MFNRIMQAVESAIRPRQVAHAQTGDALGDNETGSRYYPPDIQWDAQGNAWRWNMVNGVEALQRVPTFDDPTRAAGYQAPRQPQQYAPQYPSTQINPQTGDTFTINPYTGAVTQSGNVPGLRTQLTPEQQYQQDMDTLRQQQRYGTSERLGGQAFAAGENVLDRNFTSSESALNRALQAGQFATELQITNQQNAFQAEQAYQQAMERTNAARLGAAQQVADNISNVDPGALPAFYAAGGGNIANALGAGASAQSDLANIGAARSWATAEGIQNPKPFQFQPVTFDWQQFMPKQQAPVMQTGSPGPLIQQTPQQMAQGRLDEATALGKPTGGWTVTPEGRFAAGNPFAKMAGGGYMPGGMAVVGEGESGNGRDAELVMGDFVVMNEDQLGFPPERMSGVRKAADGGAFGFSVVQDFDRPYLDRVRQIRNSVDTSDPLGIGPYNTKYRTLAPSLQQRQAASYQTKFGIPTQDFFAEEARYRVPGTSRGAFALNY